MIVDFQISATAFLAAQKAALESRAFCTPPIIAVGPVSIVIDRIEFGVGSLRHNLPGIYSIDYPYLGDVGHVEVNALRTQIVQPVTAYVTSLNDLLQHRNGLPSVVVPISGAIVLDMQFFSGNAPDQNCYLNLQFTDFELGPLPLLPAGFDPSQVPLPISVDDILTAIRGYLTSVIPNRKVPIDIVSALPVKPSALLLVNAGVSVDTTLQRLSFRVQVGPSAVAPDAPWINFFKGSFDDRLQGAEWGLFMPGDYIAAVIQTLIQRAVSDGLPDELTLSVGSSYSNAGGHAVINNNILGIYHTPWPLPDLQSNPQIPITVSLNSPNVLTIDVGAPDIHDLVESFIPQWAQLFLRVTGPVGSFLSALIDSATAGIKAPGLPPECHRTAPANIRCTQTVRLPGLSDVVSPTVTALLALDDGISLTGPLRNASYVKGVLDVTAHDFKLEAPSISCGGAGLEIVAAFADSPTSFDILHAQAFVAYDGTLPAFVCSVTTLLDSKKVFPPSAISWDYQLAPSTIRIHPQVPPPAYYSEGAYPCVLLVKTTAGARVISIPPPPVLTRLDVDRIKADLIIKLGNCEQLYDPWWKRQSLVDPPWEINPRDRVDTLHLWEVEVRGLEPGATITLTDSSRNEIATARARQGQAVRTSALVVPGHAHDLSIAHGGAQRMAVATHATSEKIARQLAITQRLLLSRGHIQLGQRCLQLHPAMLLGQRAVLAVMADRVTAFDVSGAGAVRPLASWSRPGTRGILTWREGLLLFGRNGFEALDSNGTTVGRSSCCGGQDIRSAAVASGMLFGAGADGLRRYTPQLCGAPVGVDDAEGVLTLGRRLLVASRSTVTVYDVTGSRWPAAVQTARVEGGIRKISRPSAIDAGSFLVTADDGSSRVMAFDDKAALEELAAFGRPPWFEHAVRMGDALARISDEGNTLEIDQLGPAIML